MSTPKTRDAPNRQEGASRSTMNMNTNHVDFTVVVAAAQALQQRGILCGLWNGPGPDAPPPAKLRFVHRFSGGVSCEMMTADVPPAPGSQFVWNFEWTGRPRPKHINEYRMWVLSTTQLLSDRWGISIMYILIPTSRLTELWHFAPGQAPKLIQKFPFALV